MPLIHVLTLPLSKLSTRNGLGAGWGSRDIGVMCNGRDTVEAVRGHVAGWCSNGLTELPRGQYEEGEEAQAHCPETWARHLEVTSQPVLGVSQRKVWGKSSWRGRGKI